MLYLNEINFPMLGNDGLFWSTKYEISESCYPDSLSDFFRRTLLSSESKNYLIKYANLHGYVLSNTM